jgi:hypothetical protein
MRILLVLHDASSFVARMVTLSVELSIAATVIFGAVYVGHELREWREWYWALPPTFGEAPSAPAATEP